VKFQLKYIVVILLLLILFFAYKMHHNWQKSSELKKQAQALHVDFDQSMQGLTYASVFTREPICGHIYVYLRDLYKKNNLSVITPLASPKIPKIIHQIWLGSPLPDRFKVYQQSWITHHPDWEYKLWTDANVKDLILDNQDLYEASTNYGEKSDILRYELLYRYGGVYVDIDYECLKPLDILHYSYDLYTGIQPMDTGLVQLGLGLIGAIPGHPMLKKCIVDLRESTEREIVARTGPIYFTKIFWHFDDGDVTQNVALPSSYLYPKGYNQKDKPAQVWQKPESFAVHHWAGSWIPSKTKNV